MKRSIIIPLLFLSLICVFGINALAQEYRLPPYQKFILNNGLTVYLMEQHEVPLINVSVVLPAGAIYDGNKAGLASFTATALKHGTKKYPKAELDEALDFIGASISTRAAKEFASLTAEFASKDKEKVLDMITDLLTHPVFDEIEFEKEKRRVLVALEQAKESPRLVIGSYFDKLLFGDHVYGNSVSGSITSVNALTASDLKAFYKANYVPKGAAIAIVGDFSSKDMKKAVTQLLSGWIKGKQENANLASRPITKPAGNKVLLVNKEDAKETTFYIGAPGVSRNNPDFIAIDVINTLFGGRFTSMLNDELRVNSGLTYGAYSLFTPFRNGGSFVISTFTAGRTTEAAIDKALDVLKKLHAEGINETALLSAKNYIKGQFPPRFETSGQLASLLTQMYWYNFDESFINNFQKDVDGLTLGKAASIIQTYFPQDKLQFVLIGKSADIKKIAAKYGPVAEVQISGELKNAF